MYSNGQARGKLGKLIFQKLFTLVFSLALNRRRDSASAQHFHVDSDHLVLRVAKEFVGTLKKILWVHCIVWGLKSITTWQKTVPFSTFLSARVDDGDLGGSGSKRGRRRRHWGQLHGEPVDDLDPHQVAVVTQIGHEFLEKKKNRLPNNVSDYGSKLVDVLFTDDKGHIFSLFVQDESLGKRPWMVFCVPDEPRRGNVMGGKLNKWSKLLVKILCPRYQLLMREWTSRKIHPCSPDL